MEEKKFLSFSGGYTDLILHHILADVENGFYIDVGANDPWASSVTKHFSNHGWNGINIEPLVKEYTALCEDRPRDINLNIGVGKEDGKILFLEARSCSTCDPMQIEEMKIRYPDSKLIEIPIKTLAWVTAQYAPNDVHFLKIDVEGFELSVLQGTDFSTFRPWIILIESLDPTTRKSTHHKWEHLILQAGYAFAGQVDADRLYVCKEKAELMNRFKMPDELLSMYNVFLVEDTRSRTFQATCKIITPLLKLYGLFFNAFGGKLFRSVVKRFPIQSAPAVGVDDSKANSAQ